MAGEREVFRKSGVQTAMDGCAGPVGAVLFLGMAVLGLTGVLGSDLLMRLFTGLGFGFFGLMMAMGSITTWERGNDDRVIEIGPDGAWLPGMGHLPWAEVAEVRLGTMRGAGGGDAPVTVGYRRLGFVPRDPAIRPSPSQAGAWRMVRLYTTMVRAIAPQVRFGMDDDAPFSAGEPELSRGQFDRLLALTQSYVDVVDVAERRAHERAARWATPATARPATERLTIGDIADIDAGLGKSVRSRATSSDGLPALAPLVDPATLRPAEPRASFAAPPSSPLRLVALLWPVVLAVGMMVGFPVMAVSTGDISAIWWFLGLWVVFLGGFVVAAIRPFLRELRRRREIAANPISLEVGPTGIRLPPGGTIPWDDVAEIRTERAGLTSAFGGPGVERWRLVVVRASDPRPGSTMAVDSDRLDARFDDVLDLIRFYHPVVERS